ncbi:LysR family transcriptional regulator [Sporolactobacillus pectinivorans]|uniref:LysR family transcriptional regulator n=1 Tax=Sporolactobacillus pectinivorans TaxID=1591408 RepID=UPI000C25B58A|nr:LysR family transcriptional regulator [Sporolactobacillus pectinivorans]
MDIRILKYFLAVAQEESITRAAEVLHTSQPNLSRQLTELEEGVGRKLFERGSRKITLTEEGMFLRKRAKEIVELLERTEADLSLFNEATSGVIHIGAAETHAMRLLADAILSLRKAHPQIQYDIFSGSTIEVTEQLNKGLLDFGVLVAPVDLQKYDYLKFPINDIFGVMIRKDSPLAKLNSICPDDIKNQPVLCSRQQLDGNVLSGWLGDDSKNLNIVSTFNLITTPAMMVEAGLGLAFTFDKLVNTTGDSNLCFRPLEPRVETELYLVWKKYQMFTKPAKVFLEEVQRSIF